MFRIDKKGGAPCALHFGNGMECQRSLARSLAPKDFHDAPSGITPNAQGCVEGHRTSANYVNGFCGLLSEKHHRTVSEVFFDLPHRILQSFVALSVCGERSGRFLLCHGKKSVLGYRLWEIARPLGLMLVQR